MFFGPLNSIKIVDEDVDFPEVGIDDEDEEREMAYAPREERPSVAAVVDERPHHLIRKDMDRSRWRTLQPSGSSPDNIPVTNATSGQEAAAKNRDKRLEKFTSRNEDNDGDLSPPRSSVSSKHANCKNSDDDLSPPRSARSSRQLRHKGSGDDLSPPRHRPSHVTDSRSCSRRPRHDSDRDLSPPRPGARSHVSPVRDSGGKQSQGSDRRRERESRPVDARAETLGGKVAGLSDSKSVREEVRRLKEREAHLMQQLGDDALGKNAKTVFRDRGTGRVRDLEAEAAVKVKPDKEEEERAARYKDWSQGLKQRQDQKQRLQEDLKEMEKPLARYEDDEDREQLLKAKELHEDPMLQFVRRKKEKDKVRDAATRGELVFRKPVYSGPPPPPNRYAILPGHRWDGVDRSNGFEHKLLDKQAEKMAMQEEAYKWSTEDM